MEIQKTTDGYKVEEYLEAAGVDLDEFQRILLRAMPWQSYGYEFITPEQQRAQHDQNTLLYRLNRRYVDKQDPGLPVPGDYRKG